MTIFIEKRTNTKFVFKAYVYAKSIDPPIKCEVCLGTGQIGGGVFDLDDAQPCGCNRGFKRDNLDMLFPPTEMIEYLQKCLDEWTDNNYKITSTE